MQNLSQSRLASVLAVIVGAWLLLTPLAISMTGAALVNILVVGGVIALAGLVQLFWMNTLPSWVTALAAIWLFISAFAYSVSNGAAWNEVVFAVVTFILATWDGIEVGQVRREHHMHT
jgi:xanthine/uracil/vitamin C permease (AzgA family)